MNPSIEVAKKIAGFLGSTVGYLLGETQEANLFKNPDMPVRLNDIVELPDKEKEGLLLNMYAFLQDAKTRKAYARK